MLDFPSADSNEETYSFTVDYTEPTSIRRVQIVSQSGVKYFPSDLFTAFVNLEELRMNSTGLEELNENDFLLPMKLVELDLSGNRLRVINSGVFSHVAKFAQTLPQPSNISTIAVSRNQPMPLYKLRTLILDRNEIADIEDHSFRGLISLFDLRLKENRLRIVRNQTFVGLPSLAFLDLAKNQIETIEEGAFDFQMLEVLYLGENKLKSLSDDLFSHLRNIQLITLNQNEFERIGQSLYGVSTLEHIFLNNNRIGDINLTAIAQMRRLRYLQLENSGFTFSSIQIDPSQQSDSSLEYLDLSDNNLANATELAVLRIFPNLTTLKLERNPYENLSIDGNETDETVEPSQNKTLAADQRVAQNFVHLVLSKSYLTSIMRLFMEYGPERSHPYKTIKDVLPSLTHLHLNRTNINCTRMSTIVRKLGSKGVEVNHDCQFSKING